MNKLVEKLRDQCQLTVSTSTASRHMKRFKNPNCLPLNTPVLTSEHKQRRIEWTREHLNDDWQSTIFTDEAAKYTENLHLYTSVLHEYVQIQIHFLRIIRNHYLLDDLKCKS